MFNLSTITNSILLPLGRTGLVAQKYAPEILTGTGVVGVVATAVLASKATLKLSPVLETAREHLAAVDYATKNYTDSPSPVEGQYYTKRARAQDLLTIYVRTAFSIAKVYAPAIIVGSLSIACLVGSTRILRGRNVALAVAYKGLENQFEKYRERIVERIGEEDEKKVYLGERERSYQVKDDDGNDTESVVKVTNLSEISPYARFFDDTCNQWERDAETNLVFLRGQQAMANDKLRLRGHLFLNEVYDALGFERTKEGAVVGWVLSKDGSTDNFVDFGIYDIMNDQKRAFVNGYEKSILLDFNVDGLIWDKI